MMGGWTYMLRCADRSYYVGSTSYNDVGLRVAEHNDAKFAGYTAARRPVELVWSRWFDDLRDAHETERRLKGWSRAKKEALLDGNADKLRLLSRRRAGKLKEKPRISKRELATSFNLTGSRHPEARAERAPKDGSRLATLAPHHDDAGSGPGSRHPEARAERAPKDE
jgi:putative endonuclease